MTDRRRVLTASTPAKKRLHKTGRFGLEPWRGDMTSFTAEHDAAAELSFLWLEITGKCQLRCTHCYANQVRAKRTA